MYNDELFEHFKYPKFKKIIQNPDFSTEHYNPSCGDKIAIQGKIIDGYIIDIGFSGSGCVISQAAAAMLTELCIHNKIDIIMQMTSKTIIDLINIDLGPTRLKCALLSLEVIQAALINYIAHTKYSQNE